MKQIIKKFLFSHFSVNKGLIQHVVQSCYDYNLTFRKLEIHTVKMRLFPACYTSGRGAPHCFGFGRCTINTTCKATRSRSRVKICQIRYRFTSNLLLLPRGITAARKLRIHRRRRQTDIRQRRHLSLTRKNASNDCVITWLQIGWKWPHLTDLNHL